jgi:hypothetical protein
LYKVLLRTGQAGAEGLSMKALDVKIGSKGITAKDAKDAKERQEQKNILV